MDWEKQLKNLQEIRKTELLMELNGYRECSIRCGFCTHHIIIDDLVENNTVCKKYGYIIDVYNVCNSFSPVPW